MLKPQIPLTKQLAPLIIFLAIVILCTLVISNRRGAKKRAQEAAILPMEEQQLRMELSPFKYSGNMVMEGDYGERRCCCWNGVAWFANSIGQCGSGRCG